ncbi:F-box/kelch-repeat protein At3g23880-like [Rhododendron vialii]|uniref:F-box/kelch-repeat protein At3g23880-like n=1 Tax=Rhododendron vialii TaxID=182163 RepID=UPI00265DEEFE|nr:F-box/kelch-repeat protein At3g23880-like [Rhododendron vialii]
MIPSGGGERKRTRRSEEEEKEEDPNFPHIPEEIVFILLSRLPGKSRSRFKCVSKRWRSFIASRQKEKLLVLSGDSLHRSVDREGTVEPIAEPWQRNVSPDRTRFVQILGSCDGLVLIRIDYDLFLWNPATRYFEKVASHYALKDSSRCAASGLCYDSSTEEYKAVLALEGVWAQTVEVGSLRNKCWTEVRLSFAKCRLNPGPIVNGHLHWFAYRKQGLASIILEFNPQKNTFAKVLMPQSYGKKTIILGLGALEGCLCMARLDNRSNPRGNVEVLVMKGFGVEKTWIAMFTISNLTGFKGEDELVPLYFMTSGEVLVKNHTRKDHRKRIKAHKDNEIRNMEILILLNCINNALQYWASCIDAVQYEESLVEPIGYNIRQEEELGGKVTYVEYINRICHQRSTLVSYGHLEEFFVDEG